MIKGKTAADKVAYITELASQNGWSGTSRHHDDYTTLKLTRGSEIVEIRYEGNSCKEMPIVGYDGQIRQVRNAAAAVRVLEQDAKTNAAVFSNRAEKKNGMRKTPPVKRSPGQRAMASVAHLAEMADEDVRAKLVGKKLIWTNKLSGDLQEDFVEPKRNKKPEHFNVRDGRVSFIGNYGFRSVKLDQLVAIR